MGRAEHPRDLEAARAALRGERAVREAAPPGPGDRRPAAGRAADGRAVRRADGARHDRRVSEPGRRRGRCRCAPRASRSCSASRSRSTSPRRSSAGSASTSPRRTEEMDVGVPGFRDADVQREADLIEEVARIYGLDKLPTTLPARERAVGRLTQSQRLRRRIEDALRDRGLYEIVAWSFTAPETIERLRLATCRCCELANPLSEDQSRHAPAAPARPARRGAPQRAPTAAAAPRYFESAHVYRMAGPLDAPGEGSPARRRCRRAERHHVARAYVPGRLLRREGRCSRRCSASLRVAVRRSSRASGPFLHPGRVGQRDRGRRRAEARLDRRAAPAGRARLGPAGRRRRSSSTLDALAEISRPGAHGYRRRLHLPGRRAGHRRGRRRRTSRPPTSSAPSREAAGELLERRAALRRLPRRAGRRGQEVARAAARVPRARPHAHRRRGGRACASGSRRALAEIGGKLRG